MSVTPTPILSTASVPSLGSFILAGLTLGALLACIYAVFYFGRRLQSDAYRREYLVNSVAFQEKNNCLQSLENEKWWGPIDGRNPLPPECGNLNADYFWRNNDEIMNISDNQPEIDTYQFNIWKQEHNAKVWGKKELEIYNRKKQEIQNSQLDKGQKAVARKDLEESRFNGPLDSEGNPMPDNVPDFFNAKYFWGDQQGYILGWSDSPPNISQNAIDDWRKKLALKKWGLKEKEIYEMRKKEIERDAKKQAEKIVPKAPDISVLGGGFSFLLEFSTVIVIIFALVILAILGTLQGNEISAILAAIAGYVLGKATMAVQASKSKTDETKTQEVAPSTVTNKP